MEYYMHGNLAMEALHTPSERPSSVAIVAATWRSLLHPGAHYCNVQKEPGMV